MCGTPDLGPTQVGLARIRVRLPKRVAGGRELVRTPAGRLRPKRLDRMQQNATLSRKLTPLQEQVIETLADGANVTEAAQQANVDRTTVYRWKENPVFAAELNREKLERREKIRSAYCALLDDALRTARKVMMSSYTPPGVRLKAAMAVLDAAGALETETIGPITTEAMKKGRRPR